MGRLTMSGNWGFLERFLYKEAQTQLLKDEDEGSDEQSKNAATQR